MKTAIISKFVHYIGVNDRCTRKFEGLWPLPAGVSYNSYLIEGPDKCAIVDGVDCAHALQQIEHIKAILGDRRPDYLIINHMEPDHSGAISILRQTFPGLTVVGNALTLGMVAGFYGAEGPTLTVKDGDTLSLGEGCTLRFVITPMVHWPETMMTYLNEEATLFSGDAFGCFGALNGAVLDTDMDTERYFPEMVRYYSNIVGRYGEFVQRALKKLAGETINTICSTHGPVWRNEIARVVDLYDKLSRYEALDNGVTIVYGSMYGNTERMAEAAAEALAAAGVRDISVWNASHSDPSFIIADIFRHKGLVIASPTYSDGLFPAVETVMQAMATRKVKNRAVMLIGSNTWNQRAVAEMNRYLEICKLSPVAPPVVFKQAPGSDALANTIAAATELAHLL